MGYANIFQKLDQDLAKKLKQLEAQQQELLEMKQSLQNMQDNIQNFLNSAQEIKILVESEPELLKSLRLELGKIFSMQTPSLPIQKSEKKSENSKPSSEESLEQEITLKSSLIIEEEESINNSTFVDAQGQHKSFN